MYVVTNGNDIPETGEWIMSPDRNKFVVTLENNGPFFKDYDRLAVLANVREKVGESEDPDKSKFMVGIQGLRSLDGKNPDKNLDKEEEAQLYFRHESFQGRLADALNLWAESITEEQKEDVWAMGNAGSNLIDALDALKEILGHKAE